MKKGIFFTAMFVVLLSILLISLSIWAEENKIKEKRLPEKIKTDSFAFLLSQITDGKLSEAANLSTYRAMGCLAQYELEQNYGGLGELGGVKNTIIALAENGSVQIGGTNINCASVGADEELVALEGEGITIISQPQFTLRQWMESVNGTANEMGFEVKFGKLKLDGASVEQNTPWSVKVSFEVDVNITDFEGKMYLAKSLTASAFVPIEGLPDPLVGRSYWSLQSQGGYTPSLPLVRQIIHNENLEDADSVKPEELVNDESGIVNGAGWFYGQIYEGDEPSGEEHPERIIWKTGWMEPCIGIGNPMEYGACVYSFWENISAVGAVIITNTETHSEEVLGGVRYYDVNCLNCREWIEYDENPVGYEPSVTLANESDKPFAAGSWPYSASISDGMYVLIANEDWDAATINNKHRIYSIENLREVSKCQLYVENADAPSYLQRFLNGG
ncbi:hypothetical protein COV61_02220, partial [Candidatus Micrarchaeota archaeon CG11_big_fil_rev_8_21_14_0_20_47_5]